MKALRSQSLLILFIIALAVWGCEKPNEECVFIPETSDIKVDFEFEQFEDSLANISSKEELVGILTRQPLIRDYIFRRTEYPNDSIFINEIYRKFSNPGIDTLLKETKKVFGDLSGLRAQFQEAFTNIKYYYPDFVPPKVQTLISGIDTDLFVSDTLIIVSVDFFLGQGAKYRPRMYDYQLRQYGKDNIVPNVLLMYGISSYVNKTDMNDKTMIADMIAYGKSFYFAKHMLPCIPDSTLIWYTSEEVKGSRENQNLIWARFLEDQVIFSTSHMEKKKYLSERPKTIEVGEKCPGRIGQWVGWQIVNSYAQRHEKASLRQIMEMENARTMFKESGYKPRK